MRAPTKRQILDIVEGVEVALSSMMTRWQSIPAEVRAEIMTEAYEPILRLLIQSERRGMLKTVRERALREGRAISPRRW